MAVVRPRSAPPYATIIFVFLWVIATGVAIWLGVKNGEADKRTEAAESRAKAAVASAANASVADMNLKKVIEPEATGKTGDEVVADAVSARQKAGFADGGLISALGALADQLTAQKQQVAQLQAANADLDNQVKQGIQANSTALAGANQTLNQEKAGRAKAEAEAAKERTDKEALLAQKEADLTKFKDAAEQTRRQQILEIEKLNQDIASRDTQIVSLRQELAAKRVGNTTLAIQPAGTIVRANPGSTECYISLGRSDRIMPGLTFSVHDPRIGVRLQADTDINAKPDPTAGGKGSIEVVEVGAHESLCRITSLKKDQHIETGDLIANLFYSQDRNKKSHFVVYGDFDLDGDGVATAAEHDRLVRMITAWGGVVDDQLTADTDYLVLGERPTAPSTTKASTEAGGVADERLRQQTQYDNLFAEAKRSSVPILNANRFLAFIGYYNNTIVH